MSSGIKLSSSTPVLQTSNGEISSDGPVFTVTRSSRSHAALSSMPESAAGCDSATHGVGLYEPSSNINHSENGWYSMKSSASPPYFDQPQTIIDVESNLPNSKIDSGFSPQHDVDLTTVFVPHMVFSCLALWCCGCFLGCFGFLFAVVSARYENQGQSGKAKVFSYISFTLSLLGFLTGITAIVLLILSSFGVM